MDSKNELESLSSQLKSGAISQEAYDMKTKGIYDGLTPEHQAQVKQMMIDTVIDVASDNAGDALKMTGATVIATAGGGAVDAALVTSGGALASRLGQAGAGRFVGSLAAGGGVIALGQVAYESGNQAKQLLTGELNTSGATIYQAVMAGTSILTGENYATGQKNEGSIWQRVANAGADIGHSIVENQRQTAINEAKKQ